MYVDGRGRGCEVAVVETVDKEETVSVGSEMQFEVGMLRCCGNKGGDKAKDFVGGEQKWWLLLVVNAASVLQRQRRHHGDAKKVTCAESQR